MTRSTNSGGAFLAVFVLLALAVGYGVFEGYSDRRSAAWPEVTPEIAEAEVYRDVLYGRIATVDGATYAGRLRFGGDQEAFWGDTFIGFKRGNPWRAHVAPERLKERRPIEILGIQIGTRERNVDLGRPFMMRFGDIARVEARGRDVLVTLKSGTEFVLDRYEAGDFDDGVRVWDGEGGVVDLESSRIHSIEFLDSGRPDAAPDRMYGTVRTRQGDFTGFLQWNREKCVGSDQLEGRTADGRLSLRFETLRSIVRRSGDGAVVTLLDGREILLSGDRQSGQGNRGIHVDDRRFGRVLVSYDAFERVDFRQGAPAEIGPAYQDFPPGRPLTGGVRTRDGQRLLGRLVFDLDESEMTESLDGASRGVQYNIPFGMIASIAPAGPEGSGRERAEVTLHGGEKLELERTGDLGGRNAGMLVFVDGHEHPEYVPWPEVEQVELDRPPAMVPPLRRR